jgi:hypothetical protein
MSHKVLWETEERMVAPPCSRVTAGSIRDRFKKEAGIFTEPVQFEGQIILGQVHRRRKKSGKGIANSKSLLEAIYLHFKSNSCCLQICFKII